MSSNFGVLARARDAAGNWHNSEGGPPEVTGYLEGVKPSTTPHPFSNVYNIYDIDTSHGRCIVTAKKSVTIGTEVLKFSHWIYTEEIGQGGPALSWTDRSFPLAKGEYGIALVEYGTPVGARVRMPSIPAEMLERFSGESHVTAGAGHSNR